MHPTDLGRVGRSGGAWRKGAVGVFVFAALAFVGCDEFLNPRPYKGSGGSVPGDGGTDGATDDDGGIIGDACTVCVSPRCSAQTAACNRNAACQQIQSCADFYCAAGDDACVESTCFPQSPAGQSDYRSLITCNRTAVCSTCRAQCQAYLSICSQ